MLLKVPILLRSTDSHSESRKIMYESLTLYLLSKIVVEQVGENEKLRREVRKLGYYS